MRVQAAWPLKQRHVLHFHIHELPFLHGFSITPLFEYDRFCRLLTVRECLPSRSWMEFNETVRPPWSSLIIVNFGHLKRVHAVAPVARHQQLLQSFLHLVPGTQDGAVGVLVGMAKLSFVLRSSLWYSLWNLVDSEMDRRRRSKLSNVCSELAAVEKRRKTKFKFRSQNVTNIYWLLHCLLLEHTRNPKANTLIAMNFRVITD